MTFAEMIKDMQFDVISEEEAEAREREQREHDRLEAFKRSGVGERYWNLTLDAYIVNEDNRECYEAVCEYIKSGAKENLWLVGDTGTGKTMLGAMIIKSLGGVYRKAYQLINEGVQAQSFGSGIGLNRMINDYAHQGLLVIDEVGKGFNKDMELNILWQLLNERYERQVATVLISNLSKAELANYLGSHLTDRFADGCKAVEFKGKSMRGNK